MTFYDMGRNTDFCLYRHRLCLENDRLLLISLKCILQVKSSLSLLLIAMTVA